MATKTSVGSGKWSASGTWDAGVPADNDVVVIAAGHVVEFDVDQSGFADGIDGLTITGTLSLTRTTGTYYLKIKAAKTIGGAGTFDCGTSVSPIPFAAKHTITGGSGWYVNGGAGLTMTVYAAEPAIKTILLSGDEAIGQTELSVDTDITGDIWADGDTIRIDDINKAAESEERVIAAGGRASGTITITAGLTAAKSTGAVVSLISRNVKFIGVGASGQIAQSFGSGKFTVAGGMWKTDNFRMLYSMVSPHISAGTFSGGRDVLHSCHYGIVSGGIFTGNSSGVLYAGSAYTILGGSFTGNYAVIYNCGSPKITGGIFKGNGLVVTGCSGTLISGGIFLGNAYVLNGCHSSHISGGTITYNKYPISSNYGLIMSGVTIENNTEDINGCRGMLYGVTLGSATEHISYTHASIPTIVNLQSNNHDGVDGAIKAWCTGGIVTSQTSVKPTGYTQAYLHALESATYPAFWTKAFSVEPGKTVNIEVQLRKDASMAYLPRVYLMASVGNPLAGVTPVDTFTMTDSTDTWEADTFTITNSTDYDQDYTLWFVAQNATGNAYSAYDITTAGGGTSAVKILPFTGKVGL